MSYLEELLPEFRKGAKIRRMVWNKEFYIFMRDDFIYTGRGGLFKFDYEEFSVEDWELYQEPTDWDYIIKNKCLCWFWDDVERDKCARFLSRIENNGLYTDISLYTWKNCLPVRRDEVTFYEDRKND